MFTLKITNFPTATALKQFLQEHTLIQESHTPLFRVGKTEYELDIRSKYEE